ncbi:MAG: VOC family protein, partial [Vulcanimicrobiaceae bacterium]
MYLAVHSLDHFALIVPDPETGAGFYSSFGLRTSTADNALKLETPSGVAGVLYEGPAKHLHHVTFGIAAGERDAFCTRLEDGGIALLDPPREAQTEGVWFRDPDGNL